MRLVKLYNIQGKLMHKHQGQWKTAENAVRAAVKHYYLLPWRDSKKKNFVKVEIDGAKYYWQVVLDWQFFRDGFATVEYLPDSQ